MPYPLADVWTAWINRIETCTQNSQNFVQPFVVLPLKVVTIATLFPIAFAAPARTQITPATDGTGTIVQQNDTETVISGGQISGDGQNLFQSFEQFDLPTGEVATFLTPATIETVLGRVTGGSASHIDGTLAIAGSDANLYLINPAGILFGANANVNLAGDLVLTTADAIGFGDQLTNQVWDWRNPTQTNYSQLNGAPSQFRFETNAPGSILNAANLTLGTGQGFSAIAGTIVNTGQITAPGGQITLAAVSGNERVRLTIPGYILSLEVDPLPIVEPDAGVLSLPQILTGDPDRQHASRLQVNVNGSVSLMDSPIAVQLEPGTSLVSGTLNVATAAPLFADAQVGAPPITPTITPQITVLGDRVATIAADLNASALNPGGTILLGGDFQGNGTVPNASLLYVDADSVITADGAQGTGGRIILWSDVATIADGVVSAQGEMGGFVEISGKEYLDFNGRVDVSGRSGVLGTVLFDPEDLTIGSEEPTSEVPPPNDTIAPEPPEENPLPPPPNDTITPEPPELPKPQEENPLPPPPDDTITPEPPEENPLPPPPDDAEPPEQPEQPKPPGENPLPPPPDDTDPPDPPDPPEPPEDNPPLPPETVEPEPPLPPGEDPSQSQDFRVRLSVLDTFDLEAVRTFEAFVQTLPIDLRRAALTALRNQQEADLKALQDDPQTVIDRFIQNETEPRQVNSRVSELSVEDLENVVGNLALEATGDLVVDRPLNRSGSVALSGDQRIDVNAPIRTSGRDADVYIAAGDSINIRSNIDTRASNGNITIVAEAPTSNQRALFSANGVSITQTPEAIINAGSGDVFVGLEGNTVGNIVLGNISTVGNITVDANGGNILRLNDASAIRASSGSFVTTGVGQIGEPNNPLRLNIAELLLQTDSGREFVSDPNRTALRDSIHNNEAPAIGGPDAQMPRLADPPNVDSGLDTDGIGVDNSAPEVEGGGEDPTSTDASEIDAEGIDGSWVSATAFMDGMGEVIGGIEQDRLQEFSRFLGRNLSDGSMSSSNARDALAKIAEQTGTHSAVVYITLSQFQMQLVVFTETGSPQVQTVAVDQQTLLDTVNQFRYEITNPRSRLRRNTQYLTLAKQLYDWIIAPITPILTENNIDTLLFSMPAGLRGLPIAALHDGEEYLVENYSLSLIPSLALVDTRYRTLESTRILAMGASQFQDMQPLPAVPVELETIASEIWDGTILLNSAFTRDNIVNSRSRYPYPIVHMATHGEFGTGESGNSFIQLWDERLALNEVRNLGWNNPPVELLVLSACRTAVGDENAELGFAGFAVAAGVKSALASLWYVSDVGTFTLMSQFYTYLHDAKLKAEALREAQLSLIHGTYTIQDNLLFLADSSRGVNLPENTSQGDLTNLSHPYYWSAFTMIGSPW